MQANILLETRVRRLHASLWFPADSVPSLELRLRSVSPFSSRNVSFVDSVMKDMNNVLLGVSYLETF
jgi:hypothetical protein